MDIRYGHFSGINRKVQLKYQPRGRPRGSSSDDGSDLSMPHLFSNCILYDYICTISHIYFLNIF